jgi:SAM-dependent methyltransferase
MALQKLRQWKLADTWIELSKMPRFFDSNGRTMKIIRFLKGKCFAWRQQAAERRLLRQFSAPSSEISRAQWNDSMQNPTEFYERCFHYFYTRLPKPLREHRVYFEKCRRGFGEKSFHVMWFLLFREFSPESFLEIGVFRGQSLSLAALIARHFKLDCFIQGVSPFSSVGDATSTYRSNINYYDDTLKNFAHFSLPKPALLKAFSTDEAAKKLIASRNWSFIYIDGNHDYEIAHADWELCASHLRPGGLIVLDDAGLTTKYIPPFFATGGHSGPSRLAQEIDQTRFHEILQVGHNRVFQKIVA